MAEYEDTLRKLALNDESFVESVLGWGATRSKLRGMALAAGANMDEIVGP